MGRTGMRVTGCLLLAIGLCSAVFALSTGAHGGFVAVGAIVGGLIRLMRASSMPEDGEFSEPGGARGPEDLRPQVAGLPCAQCSAKIASVLDGYTCERCARPCHYDCQGRHEIAAHAAVEPSAYR